ncbi:hypothetical protein GCM10011390_21930 [Aureimonas endophytica]|uniref:Uncharacterized protein n=1 Tax=Aureimonas endophytica TaxID=2027858 RepID=A0A916ZM47_9HYPH|nr:hypothetical protein GCM10011390_21930 [Aureimonas endophytica]
MACRKLGIDPDDGRPKHRREDGALAEALQSWIIDPAKPYGTDQLNVGRVLELIRMDQKPGLRLHDEVRSHLPLYRRIDLPFSPRSSGATPPKLNEGEGGCDPGHPSLRYGGLRSGRPYRRVFRKPDADKALVIALPQAVLRGRPPFLPFARDAAAFAAERVRPACAAI